MSSPISAPVAPGIYGAAPVVALPNNGGNQTPVAPTDATVAANQAQAAKMGITIPGVGGGTPKPPSEPAVLSSDGASQLITDSQTKLGAIAQKGTTVGPTGSVTYADGSAVPAPQGAVYNDKTGQYEAADGKTYSVAEFYGENGAAPDSDYTAVQNLFAPLKSQLDANTLATVNNIQQQFELLKSKQEEYNTQANQSRARTLLLGGTSRYAPLDAAGIMQSQTKYGLQQIQDLDSKENAAIATAQAAGQDGDMKLMTQALSMAESVRQDKQTAAAKILSDLQAANQKLTEQRQQAGTDSAIANVLSSGITDPAQILGTLTSAGISVTSAQVADSLKNFATTLGAAGIKGLTGDVGNFYTLKQTPGALPSSILALPEDQQMQAYIKMVNQAKSTAAPKVAGGSGGSGSGAGSATLSKAAQAWVDQVRNGNATLTNVPAALRTEVAVGLNDTPQVSYSPLAASRFATASNRITSNFIQLPQFQLTANGLPYLQRIDAAMQNPGSVSDQDLLDSLTKLNTAGNAISDAQVKLITDGRSYADSVGVALNKVGNGGVLSDSQRSQIQSIAKAIYENYKKGYQPVYDQVTKQLKDAGIPEAFWTIPDLNNLSGQIGSSDASHPYIGSSDTVDSFLSSGSSDAVSAPLNWDAAFAQ